MSEAIDKQNDKLGTLLERAGLRKKLKTRTAKTVNKESKEDKAKDKSIAEKINFGGKYNKDK